jgi:hypothetical protein
MKKAFKITSLFLVLVLITAACSKEKRIERRLASKSGKWNIETITEIDYENGSQVYSGAYSNAGNFVFDEDGTLVETYIDDGTSYVYAGTWSNTEDKLTVIEDGDAMVYEIKEYSRKEMTLVYTDEYSGGGIAYKDVITINLVKDK